MDHSQPIYITHEYAANLLRVSRQTLLRRHSAGTLKASAYVLSYPSDDQPSRKTPLFELKYILDLAQNNIVSLPPETEWEDYEDTIPQKVAVNVFNR